MSSHLTSQILEILNDDVVVEMFRRDAEERREQLVQRDRERYYSQYQFSIIYHPSVKNLLGTYDSFSVEGSVNAEAILRLKLIHNVGIQQIRVSQNGNRIRTINLSGNEEKSLNFRMMELFRN